MTAVNLFGEPQPEPRDLSVWARVRFELEGGLEGNGETLTGTGWVDRTDLVKPHDETAVPVVDVVWNEADDELPPVVMCFPAEIEVLS